MKKILFFSILFLFSVILNGCSTRDISYYLYQGDSYVTSSMNLELTDIQVEDDVVTFEFDFIKYKEVLPDFDITGITFTFQNTGYSYTQLNEYSQEKIYTSSVNGNKVNLEVYSFDVDEVYSIILSIDFSYFLADYDPNGITSGIDTDSVVIYMDVAAVHMRISSRA